ncbi:RidA family protein [Hymenobacter jeollabukensis]|uniref:RidA family protein n=1 Tax=Hymenobacter jeollabukensis TaxID=2025313 RepID=A0A5R8WLI1_9BACT|nr:RidA family protein [Hymenobacter jeollabukensis]TLM90030.1 RidA family protein [Hymenobacter jeollabukensis]
MEKQALNPWRWQDNFNFSQAVEVSGGTQTLYCAGQAAISAEGQPLHPDDMAAQLRLALANLETVLHQGRYDWPHVVRLTVYTVDFDRLFQHYGLLEAKLVNVHPKPVINLLGVNRLVFPELLVEIEATAVR